MYGVFDFLIMLPIFLGISYLIRRMLLSIKYEPFRIMITIITFVGITIHELCHAFMCLMMGIRLRHFHVDIFNRETGEVEPHGSVGYESHKTTFLQNFLIALAPLFVCTWLFFWSLNILFTKNLDIINFFCYFFFCISLLLGAPPSLVDFKMALRTFQQNPRYSLYQLFLLLISGLLVWYLFSFYQILLFVDLFYYVFVGLMYLSIKYTLKAIGFLFSSSQKPIADRAFRQQRQFKPSKPNRES